MLNDDVLVEEYVNDIIAEEDRLHQAHDHQKDQGVHLALALPMSLLHALRAAGGYPLDTLVQQRHISLEHLHIPFSISVCSVHVRDAQSESSEQICA